MKKVSKVMMAFCVLCVAFALSVQVKAADLSAKFDSAFNPDGQMRVSADQYPSGSFTVAAIYSNAISVNIDQAVGAQGVQVAVYNKSKKLMSSSNVRYFNGATEGSITVAASFSTNSFYYYRVRAAFVTGFDAYGDPILSYGSWSKWKATSTIYPKLSGKNWRITVKGPKVSGVSKYKVYVSTSATSGYKKIGTIKPGRTMVCSKVRGRSLKSYGTYTNFYFRVVPVLKSGVSAKVLPKIYKYMFFKLVYR